jgi:hypothetical protein
MVQRSDPSSASEAAIWDKDCAIDIDSCPDFGLRAIRRQISATLRRRRDAPADRTQVRGDTGRGRGRLQPAHRLDLRRAKGRPCLQVLDLCCQQLIGHGEVADLGLEPIDLEVPAVTPSSRDTSSRSSPRSSLNTALCLRLADIRRRLSVDRRNAA